MARRLLLLQENSISVFLQELIVFELRLGAGMGQTDGRTDGQDP